MILARINRLYEGLEGDIKPIGKGLSELRIHFGPGYRVYLTQRGNVLIIVLCAGSKKTQQRGHPASAGTSEGPGDIAMATKTARFDVTKYLRFTGAEKVTYARGWQRKAS